MKLHSQPFSRLEMPTGNKELDTELKVLAWFWLYQKPQEAVALRGEFVLG